MASDVWTESWVCEANEKHARIFRRGDGEVVAVIHNLKPMSDPHYRDAEDRLILASAAPALVRALLAVEWCRVPVPECHEALCSWCYVVVEDDAPMWHRSGCAVDAALTLAGFDTQQKRNAARERVSK